MRIGINTRFLLSDKMEGFGWYTYEVSKRLVEQHPEHDFIFFFDRQFDSKFVFASNVTPIVLSPPARHPFLFIYWFEIAIKNALKKHKIDVFFSPDGYLSLGSKVPQIGVIHDINFEHYPKDIPFGARTYLRHFFPKFAKKATKLITVSNYSKQDIVNVYGVDAEKITVAWNGVSDAFKPVPIRTKQEIKEKYTSGNDFFLFVGAIHPRKNIKRLVEAFFLFKSETNSPVKLLIVGESLWKNNSVQLNVSDKMQKEVVFTGHLLLEELALITGSALALTYVPYFEGFGIPLVEAMKCGTPILSGDRTSLPEVAGDSAIYCDPFNVKDISEKMQLLYSSEDLRIRLGEKGIERSKLFSWDNASSIVWNEIESLLH